MEQSNLAVNYDNEVHIKGLLYVLEIDSKKSAVSLEDIQNILK